MRQTSTDSRYYHKVVDCQWACPAHTPVPEYIRLISQGRYTEAYMVNWYSNLFPGILGRVCDRPCEPACRRGRVDKEAVAICRLKRVTADFKDENIDALLPPVPLEKNGKHIALIGAGPASLTVANDLLPYGYSITLFEKESRAGGAMFTQVPRFRLPTSVLDEEVNRVLQRGVQCFFNHEVKNLKELADNFDAVFVGTGAPQGKRLKILASDTYKEQILVGVEFLASVSFGHLQSLPKNVLVIGGGNTAMDCARTSLRLGAKNVSILAPESYDQMLASPWEKKEAEEEGISFVNLVLPKEFLGEHGKLTGLRFQSLKQCYNTKKEWDPIPSGEEDKIYGCDLVITAIGQELVFPFLDEDLGVHFKKNEQGKSLALLDIHPVTLQSTHPKIFFGGDAAFGPKNIIWAVAHGHEAAKSIHLYCQGKNLEDRPEQQMNLLSQRIGLNQWSYNNAYSEDSRKKVPHHDLSICTSQLNLEVELGFDEKLALQEAKRCLNCDVQTVFDSKLCIECDACVDICPANCLSIAPDHDDIESFKQSLKSYPQNSEQDLFTSQLPQTQRLMVKDENFCLHCGLCAERCPTAAWDMKLFSFQTH